MQKDRETNGHAVGTAEIQRGANACDSTNAYAKGERQFAAQAVGLLCLLFAPCQELRHAAAGRCQYSQWHPHLCALAELRETWTSRVRSALGGTIEVQHMPPQYTMFSRILLVLACYKGLQPFRQR